jgi:hypothetical protein
MLAVPKRTMEDRTLKRFLEWTLNRDVTLAEIATALGKPGATFSRRKDDDVFPSYEELGLVGHHFGLSARWLHVEFGYIDKDELRVEPHPFATLTEKEAEDSDGMG